MPRTLYLIDGHSHIYSAYYAIRGLTTPDGQPINAVYGFTGMLHKILSRDPDYVAIVQDVGKKTFRNDLYPQYKATRKPMPDDLVTQLPLVDELIEAHGIPVVFREGYEADDVIATLARQAEKEGLDVYILTTDKDAQQLLSDRIHIYDFRKDAEIDARKLREERGITPGQVVEAMGLSGDASDNVPGVPGIGPQTAQDLIAKYGTLEEVLKHVDEVPGEKRKENLRNFAEQARLSRRLVVLEEHVPLDVTVEELKRREPDRARLLELYRRWGFKKYQEELLEKAPPKKKDYRLINSEPLFDNFLRELRNQPRFSIDLETTSQYPRDADVVGISFAWHPDEAYYLALRSPMLEPHLDAKPALAALKPILEDEQVKKTGQNLKYDSVVLLNSRIEMRGIEFDTMLASWVLNPGRLRHGLDDLSAEYLGHKMTPITDLIGKGKKQVRMDEVPTQAVSDYSCDDAAVAWALTEILRPKLAPAGLDRLYYDVELPLIAVLRDMEWTGIAVDVKQLAQLGKEMGARLAELEKKVWTAAGETFNIDSTQQLGAVLFEKLKLPGQKRMKTGWSTDQEVLETLAPLHALPKLVLAYRQLSKLKGTYVDALPEMVSPRTGRIHASFNQVGTATGRLSSNDPNMQNIPVRSEEGGRIREAFVPGASGSVLLSADYSQIELRFLAHYTGDRELREAFERGDDIHAFVAAQINGLKQDDVTPEMRREAKVVNFGIMYGLSPFGLARALGIPREEAARFIDAYYAKYESIGRFFEKVLTECRDKGYVTTILGRRRYLQGIRNVTGHNRNQPERMAINTVCQGSAADLIKVAMVNIHRRLRERACGARLILQIHDELLFEVPQEEVEEVKSIAHGEMTSAIPLDVPLVVNFGVGKNWAEAK